MAQQSPAQYKLLKEAFVSNLSGGSVSEINFVSLVVPAATFLWSTLQSRHVFFEPYTPLALVVDFLINLAALLLATTVYATNPLVLGSALLIPAVLLYFSPGSSLPARRGRPSGVSSRKSDGSTVAAGGLPGDDDGLSRKQDGRGEGRVPFITTYRGLMMVGTCISILAVDFRIFPRRFAKVETWGTSLMDLGVGSFVFSAGVVSARRSTAQTAGPVLPLVLGSLRHSIPLLALGFVRLLSVKAVDYVEHVSEYGVHWNFFFTLGCLPPFVALTGSALRLMPFPAALAALISATYQIALETTALRTYILSAPRADLLSMNREGVFSFFGYLAIYLAGQHVGGLIVQPRATNRNAITKQGAQERFGFLSSNRVVVARRLAISTAAWAGAYLIATGHPFGAGLTVSRRLANLPYVLWVTAFNSAQLLALCVIDAVCFPPSSTSHSPAHDDATSKMLRVFNRNGLAIFLVANLLTGVVNLTVPTLFIEAFPALAILVSYLAVLAIVALALDHYNITLRL